MSQEGGSGAENLDCEVQGPAQECKLWAGGNKKSTKDISKQRDRNSTERAREVEVVLRAVVGKLEDG